MLRLKEQPKIKDKTLVKFEDMSIETQRYISNPKILSFYKQISKEKYKYSEITYQKGEVIQYQEPFPLYKKCLLILMIMNEVLTMAILFNILDCIEGIIGQIFRFNEGFFISIPYMWKYFKTFKKENQEKYVEQQIKENKPYKNYSLWKQIGFTILIFPYMYVLGAVQFRFTIGNQVYPLFPQLRENWVQNFNPSWYTTSTRLFVQFKDIVMIYCIIEYKLENFIMLGMYPDEQDREQRIFNKNSFLYISYQIACIGFLISLIYYLFDIIYYKLLVPKYFKKQNEQIQIQKQNNQLQQQLNLQISKSHTHEIEVTLSQLQKNQVKSQFFKNQNNEQQNQNIKMINLGLQIAQSTKLEDYKTPNNTINNNINNKDFNNIKDQNWQYKEQNQFNNIDIPLQSDSNLNQDFDNYSENNEGVVQEEIQVVNNQSVQQILTSYRLNQAKINLQRLNNI